ncbi:hypothetical protein AHMF7605_03770 [Adhaeribacter arboris]|uniref:Uncharacterized protein n=1 Tax=Adhaeribacter arboris TaxID=2072846 RepID=A0A2T2YB26_9BACT|nr:hypothetical protein [Adhaeribacter arboris]PSR52704.1 hypothetical protein AHMF7605_03770 [Adhaeribacter arboris]
MRRLFAYSLLAIHLFNIAGYSLLFQYFIYQTDTNLVAQLDLNKYQESELIQFKIPIPVPYIVDRPDFERVDGQVEIKGVLYTYVKRKIERDTIFLQCLPNRVTQRLSKARIAFTKHINDLPQSKKSQTGSVKKSGLYSEYDFKILNYQFASPILMAVTYNSYPAQSPVPAAFEVPGEPPENRI